MEMRRKDREVTSSEDVDTIVKKARILCLGLSDDIYPYVVPLHYGYEKNPSGQYIFYMHSAKAGHKLDLIRKNPNACIELDCDERIVSGGDVPCAYGALYSSVIAQGRAEIIDEAAEKIHGLKLLMENQTGRGFEIDEKMAGSVAVIRFTAINMTAKARKA